MTLSGYEKCIRISMDPSDDGELTNYQKKITLVIGSGTSSGNTIYLENESLNWPYDVRFSTDVAGSNLINFAREEYDATDGTWWVKVPTIAASGKTYIYLHVGDADATDASDPASTFDNFIDTSTTDGWTGDTSILSIINDDELRYNDNSSSSYGCKHALNDVRQNFVYEVKYYCENPGAESWIAPSLQDAADGDKFADFGTTSDSSYRQWYRVGATLTKLYDSVAWSTVYSWKIVIRRSASKVDYYLYNAAGSLLASATDKDWGYPAGGTPVNADQIVLAAGSAVKSDTRFQLIRTRAYAADEPEISAASWVGVTLFGGTWGMITQ